MDRDERMEREERRGIFFGIIGVLTLIVAIIGASLAYFSINAKSDDDAVIIQAASVKIVYEDGDKLLFAENIIPSKKTVAMETFRRYLAGETYTGDLGEGETQIPYRKCIDDNGWTVCGVYEFTLTNNGVNKSTITAKIVPTVEEPAEGEETTTEEKIKFVNLKYSMYDITGVEENSTSNGKTIVEEGQVTYNEFSILGAGDTIDPNTTKRYRLFIWLDEKGKDNDVEQGAEFKGTIYIDVPDSTGNITGTAKGVN